MNIRISKEANFNFLFDNVGIALTSLSLSLTSATTLQITKAWLLRQLRLLQFLFLSLLLCFFLLNELILPFKHRELHHFLFDLLLRFDWLSVNGSQCVLSSDEILTRLRNLLCLSPLLLLFLKLALVCLAFSSTFLALAYLSCLRTLFSSSLHDVHSANLEILARLLDSVETPPCISILLFSMDLWLLFHCPRLCDRN